MKKTIFLTTVASGVLLVGSPALAQSTPASQQAPQASDQDAFSADTIIVTARRRAEDVSKVPIAITAFSGEQLVAKGIQNTIDLVKITPGLNIQAGGSRANPFIVIRGQSKAVTGNGSPGVITYMNDVPLPGYGSLIQSYDMENIQVLKGPQGTLFGRNSIGGALLTVTKGPTHDFGGYVMVDVAQYKNQQIEGALNIPILPEKVALRVAAQVGHADNNIKTFLYSPYTISNPSPGVYTATPGSIVPNKHDADEFANKSFRASLLIEPTDWIKNVTVGDYSKIRGAVGQVTGSFFGGLYSLPPSVIQGILAPTGTTNPGTIFFADVYANTIIPALAQCANNDPRCNVFAAGALNRTAVNDRIHFATADPWQSRTIIKGISNTTTIRIGDNHQLKNIFSIRTTDSFTNSTLTGLATPVITTAAMTRLKQTTEEIQASGSFFGDDLKYTVGGFFYNEKPNGLGGYQALEVNSFFGLSHNLSTTYLHNSSQAAYGQIDYSPTWLIPGLTFTGGVRQTWDQQSACTTNITFSPFGLAQVVTNAGSQAVPSEAECQRNSGTNVGVAQSFQDAKFKKLTYTLGASWQITPSTMIYVTRRRGYRAGGYNTPIIDPFLANLQTFQPEVLQDWEVGTKLRFQAGGMRGTLDLAAFSGKDTANQLPVNTSNLSAGVCTPGAAQTTDCSAGFGRVFVNAQTTTVNAGTLTIRGIEAAGTLSPVPGLTFTGSLSYVDIRIDSITLPANFRTFLTAAGKLADVNTIQIQGQPTWTSNAGVNAILPDKVLGGELSASLDFHYNGSSRQVEVIIPSYHSFDARVGLDNVGGTNLSIAAYVRNITNEPLYLGGGSTATALGATSYILGNPRIAGLQLRYAFGK